MIISCALTPNCTSLHSHTPRTSHVRYILHVLTHHTHYTSGQCFYSMCSKTCADDGTDSSAVLLDTQSWAVVRQFPLPSVLADLLWMGSELGVFPETLTPAVKVSLCVCPRYQLPQVVQVSLISHTVGEPHFTHFRDGRCHCVRAHGTNCPRSCR